MTIIAKIISHRPKVKFLGEGFCDGPFLLLSNHAGRKAPSKVELYFPRDMRFWSSYELTEGFKPTHKYLTSTYFHQKKNLPKPVAWIIGTLASPFFYWFYRGMRIIPSYPDVRFMNTIKTSVEYAKNGMPIIIFPEDSSKGYKEEIESFLGGFLLFLETCYKQGLDLNIYVTYFKNKNNTFYVDNPIKYSNLKQANKTNDEIIKSLRMRMNELAKQN